MLGMFGLELRAVVMVEAGVVFDNGWIWLRDRREDARCEL